MILRMFNLIISGFRASNIFQFTTKSIDRFLKPKHYFKMQTKDHMNKDEAVIHIIGKRQAKLYRRLKRYCIKFMHL